LHTIVELGYENAPVGPLMFPGVLPIVDKIAAAFPRWHRGQAVACRPGSVVSVDFRTNFTAPNAATKARYWSNKWMALRDRGQLGPAVVPDMNW